MKTHMIGIGGAGMSGIAEVLHRRGYAVTGSDLKESPYTRRLQELGITVYIGHTAEQVGEADRVVISTAIPPTNPELMEARRRQVPVVPRAQALADILVGEKSVAVAGTHGKTTTTSMTTHVLGALGENPTALVGGELNDIGSNVVEGDPDLVVAEADESDRSLLLLRPQAAVLTNVEFDHPDFYSSLDDVVETFGKFVANLPPSGHLVACADDPLCLGLAEQAPCPLTTYGLANEAADLRAEIISPSSYRLYENGEERGLVELGVYGWHNVLNSLAAAAVARWLGHDAYEAAQSLAGFGGVRRRLQLKGERFRVRVIDDYAHHPTELSATLQAARATSEGRVLAVFQPHRYSRTRRFHREFGAAFGAADAVVVTDVYGAGESPQPGVGGKMIVDAICETPNHPDVFYVPDQGDLPRVLKTIAEASDTVLTLGAGDVSRVGDEFLNLL